MRRARWFFMVMLVVSAVTGLILENDTAASAALGLMTGCLVWVVVLTVEITQKEMKGSGS